MMEYDRCIYSTPHTTLLLYPFPRNSHPKSELEHTGPGPLTKGPRQLGRVRCLSEDALCNRAPIRRIHSEMVGMV